MVRLGFRGAFGLSIVAFAGLVLLLVCTGDERRGEGSAPRATLLLYCAAGLRPPVEELRVAYESAANVSIQTKYAGSGALLSDLRVAGGDLFLAAERDYLDDARKDDLARDIFIVARQSPVIVVRKGNPQKIAGLDDLLRPGVQLSLADPKRAAIGRVVEGLVASDSRWAPLWRKAAIQRETVNLVANDVKLHAADAGIVWDATAAQYPDLEIVNVPLFGRSKNEIAVGVLTASANPKQAMAFVNYLTAPEHGQRVFRKYGYDLPHGPATDAAAEPHGRPHR